MLASVVLGVNPPLSCPTQTSVDDLRGEGRLSGLSGLGGMLEPDDGCLWR